MTKRFYIIQTTAQGIRPLPYTERWICLGRQQSDAHKKEQTNMDKRYYHTTGNGKAYGPSNEGETLAEYKTRIKCAYGNLRGVKVGARADFHPTFFW
jgi:hypothetical protein